MKKISQIFIALLVLASASSCVKDKFDAPPTGGQDPDIQANIRIDSLKARFTGQSFQITEELVIQGIVTADDRSGNFYKTLVIQDSTAGISLRLDGTSLYNDYPIGRRLFIKLKGLYIGAYAGLIQIGGYLDTDGSLQELPSALFDKHVLKGVWGLSVAPKAVAINQLNDSYQNILIELNDVEFALTDAGKPYADGYNKSSLNRTLKNCTGNTIVVRTSGYASFANTPTPTGKGKFIGIYSTYNGAGQLLVRELTDLSMDSARCGGGVVTTNGIAGIRGLYPGSDVTIPAGKTLTGVVISDKDNANCDPKNLIVQDSTGGIVVRFTASHTYSLGDLVTVNLSGLTLSTYNGLIQVLNVPAGNVTKIGVGTITPRVATINEILTNFDAWESTLVTIQNCTISGGSTYSGTRSLNDGTGSLNHYTRSAAVFSSTALPTGNLSFTGTIGDFNGAQLSIRSLADVQ